MSDEAYLIPLILWAAAALRPSRESSQASPLTFDNIIISLVYLVISLQWVIIGYLCLAMRKERQKRQQFDKWQKREQGKP